MGDVVEIPMRQVRAIEWPLPWGPVVRGFAWDGGPDTAFLLHDPGSDVDAWGTLPIHIARDLEIETVALDLPGHGLSDDPWEPERLPELLRYLNEMTPLSKRRFVISAGATALVALELAAELELSGLICLSPDSPDEVRSVSRSPRVPKLIVAGSIAGHDLDTARRLAANCGGWAVVTSLPVTERGTALLASSWGARLTEEIGAFLRDCQQRPLPARPNTSNPPQSA